MTQGTPPLAGLAELTAGATDAVATDDIDLALLQLLVADSRMSQRRLARELGMSASAVGDRLARLEEAGVVRRYTIDINWSALGYPVVVYLTITAVEGYDLAETVRMLGSLPEVEGITIVTGAMDLLVKLRVRDHSHLRNLLLHSIWQSAGVRRTETLLSLGEVEPTNFQTRLIQARRRTAEVAPSIGIAQRHPRNESAGK